MKTKHALIIVAVLALLPSGARAQDAAYRMSHGLQMLPRSSEPGHGATWGTLWIDGDDSNKLKYCNPAGSCIALGAGGGGGSGDMVLADTQTVTGAKTFNHGTLKLFASGNAQSTTLATLASTGRTWTLPDATDTAVGLAVAQTLTNKTLTAPVLGSTVTGTYTIGGTPTIGTDVGLSADETHSIGDSSTQLLNVYTTTVRSRGSQNLDLIAPSSQSIRLYANNALRSTLSSTSWTSNVPYIETTDGITTNRTAGLTLQNTTSATTGAQEYSPAVALRGQRYSGSATKTIGWNIQAAPRTIASANGNGTDAGSLYFTAHYDGANTDLFAMDQNGASARLRGLTNPWSLAAADGGNYLALYNSIFVMGGAGMRPDSDGTQTMGGGGWAWGDVMSRWHSMRPSSALSISSNTIAPTNMIHSVGTGLLKTITAPALTAGAESIVLYIIPTGAFTWDATGNIDSGTGTAVVGRAMTFVYDYTLGKWFIVGQGT